MLTSINWTMVGVLWAVLMTVGQGVVTVVLFLLKKQAQDFQGQAATTAAIKAVEDMLQEKIEDSGRQLRAEIASSVGSVNEELHKLETGDRQLERRVIVLEQALAHAPKARDLDNLRQEITHLSSTVARFEGRQEETNRVLRLIHEFMMERPT